MPHCAAKIAATIRQGPLSIPIIQNGGRYCFSYQDPATGRRKQKKLQSPEGTKAAARHIAQLLLQHAATPPTVIPAEELAAFRAWKAEQATHTHTTHAASAVFLSDTMRRQGRSTLNSRGLGDDLNIFLRHRDPAEPAGRFREVSVTKINSFC